MFHQKKVFLIFLEMELSSSKIKKRTSYISQRELSGLDNIKKDLKNPYIFTKRSFSDISEGNLQRRKNKNFLYLFRKVFSQFRMTADEAVK